MSEKANAVAENRRTTLLDYVVLIVKWKRFLTGVAVALFVVSYAAIYFFVEEEFESAAVIVPAEDRQLGGISSLVKTLSNVPMGLGSVGKTNEMDMYTTIINSRTTLENVIAKFDLLKDYGLGSMEKAVKAVRKKIKTEVTDQNAYEITVRAN